MFPRPSTAIFMTRLLHGTFPERSTAEQYAHSNRDETGVPPVRAWH